jgi:hypothetical protein
MKEIPLSQGLVAMVDDEDYEWLNQWKWCVMKRRKTEYAVRHNVDDDGKGHTICMHREIMDAPIGLEVDHINHNGLDNRRDNLRLATRAQNAANGPQRRSGKFRGVHFQAGKYCYATAGGREGYLGSFHTPEAAALAYNHGAIELWGEFASLNPVTELDVERAEQAYAERKKEAQKQRCCNDSAFWAHIQEYR